MADRVEARVLFPFVKVLAGAQWPGGEYYRWKPGTRFRDHPEYHDDIGAVADGMGEMVITEVSRHRPAPQYAVRVFYVQQFVDPDGHAWKPKLRVMSAAALTKKKAGYRHDYTVTSELRDKRVEAYLSPEDWKEAMADAASY